MIWIKQLFKITRYFIIGYKYELNDNTKGDGLVSASCVKGKYVSIDNIIKHLEYEKIKEFKTFFIINIIELNKRDYNFYLKNNTINKRNEIPS